MGRRALLYVLVFALAGCWSEERDIDGLSPAQWAYLRDVFDPPPYADPCRRSFPDDPTRCQLATKLGQQLFFEPLLSSSKTVSCSTCHAPMTMPPKPTPAWYADLRTPNAVSMGAIKWTSHNTISLVNVALKEDLPQTPVFTWTGDCADRPCDTPSAVIKDIALPKAMGSSPALIAETINANAQHLWYYTQLFGAVDMTKVMDNVDIAFEAYMRRLSSIDAPFDRFIVGDDSAISESARRGFVLFAGKAMCIECHRGALFSDFQRHVTGVQQSGEHAPAVDSGHAGTGAFVTPALRGVAETGPYMHDGSLATLADVIWFYRQGGAATGYVGDKDPLMQPLDITDDEARDLEAFLRTLTGAPIDPTLTADNRL